jgi:hypothetical protein
MPEAAGSDEHCFMGLGGASRTQITMRLRWNFTLAAHARCGEGYDTQPAAEHAGDGNARVVTAPYT